jgi:hypothetical protein
MSIRYIAAAALMTCACATSMAGTLPAAPANIAFDGSATVAVGFAPAFAADSGSAASADIIAMPGAGAGAVAGGAGNVDIAAAGGNGNLTGNAGGEVSATLPTITLPSGVDAAAAAAVPEPSTIALMLAGVFGAGALKRRRTR